VETSTLSNIDTHRGAAKIAENRPIGPFFLDFDSDDRRQLHEDLDNILDSGILILGSYTRKFERAFADYVGAKFAVSTNSGTSALEILLRVFQVAGKKVAVPTNTNFASPAAIIKAGGVPVFMDMNGDTFCSDASVLRRTLAIHPDLAGVLWVHIGGVISPDMFDISRLCRERGLFLLEDCAHAHGSTLYGQAAGMFGDGAAFSFFPTKPMTTIEGGIIVTDNEEHQALARSYRNQGKRDGDYNALHVDFGSSWRMSEFSAAVGLRQLQKLDRMRARRVAVAEIYASHFAAAGLAYCSVAHMDRASHYKFILTLPPFCNPASVKAELAEAGIIVSAGVYEVPCHRQPVFADIIGKQGGEFPVADELCARQLCPPLTSGMTAADAERVAELVVSLARRRG
jgi:perosamine synthetase